MESFEWSLWVALVLTCVGVGVVLWLLEPWAKPQRRPTRADFKAEDLQEHVWTALGRPMQARRRAACPVGWKRPRLLAGSFGGQRGWGHWEEAPPMRHVLAPLRLPECVPPRLPRCCRPAT